mgnify:CR=1 FL=1
MLRGALWLGRNTLPVLLFSPVFTMAVKPLAGMLAPFDGGTGLLFLAVALTVAVSGSIGMAWVADRMGLSRRLFLAICSAVRHGGAFGLCGDRLSR